MSHVTMLRSFPFCVPRLAEDGEPFQQWDGQTYYSVDSQFSFNVPQQAPSKTEDSIITVYGQGSMYPIGPLTLEQAMHAYWKVKEWSVTINYDIQHQTPPVEGYDPVPPINGTWTYNIKRGRCSPKQEGDDHNLIRFHYADESNLVCYNDPFEGVQDVSPYGYSEYSYPDYRAGCIFIQGSGGDAEYGKVVHNSALGNYGTTRRTPVIAVSSGTGYEYWMAAPIIINRSGFVLADTGDISYYTSSSSGGGSLTAIGANPFSAVSLGYTSSLFGAHFGSVPATVNIGSGTPISTSFWGMGYGNATFSPIDPITGLPSGSPPYPAAPYPDSTGITISVTVTSVSEFEYSSTYGGSDITWNGWGG